MKLSTLLACSTLFTIAPLAAGAGELDSVNTASSVLAGENLSLDGDTFITQIKEGKLDKIRLFFEAGASPGTQNKDNVSGLAAAIATGKPDIIELLLSHMPQGEGARATVGLQDNAGNTALHVAVDKADEATLARLLAFGPDLSVTNKAHETALVIALKKKNEALVKALVAADEKAIVPFGSIGIEDSQGNKPLAYAIMMQSQELVKLLLASRADAVEADTVGVTPLMLAAAGGDETIARMLLDKGAKINAVSKNGQTPVLNAIRHGHNALAKMLIQKDPATPINYMAALDAALEVQGADPVFFTYLLGNVGSTEALPPALLFKAFDHKNTEAARLLMARNIDLKAVNENNETLFYHALNSGSEEIALEMMKKGVDVTQTGVSGISPIARAVRYNMPKVVSILIEKGASPNQKTAEGYTLAEVCVYSGSPETLEVLLSRGVTLDKDFALLWSIRDGKGKAVPVLLAHGAVPNIMDPNGTPAITLAAEAGEAEAVKAFIEHKAAIDYPSKNQQQTALHAAARSGNIEVVRMLVEAGANIRAADAAGLTPLAHAASLSRVDAVDYLLKKGADPRATDGQKRSVMDLATNAPASQERDKTMHLIETALQAAAH